MEEQKEEQSKKQQTDQKNEEGSMRLPASSHNYKIVAGAVIILITIMFVWGILLQNGNSKKYRRSC